MNIFINIVLSAYIFLATILLTMLQVLVTIISHLPAAWLLYGLYITGWYLVILIFSYFKRFQTPLKIIFSPFQLLYSVENSAIASLVSKRNNSVITKHHTGIIISIHLSVLTLGQLLFILVIPVLYSTVDTLWFVYVALGSPYLMPKRDLWKKFIAEEDYAVLSRLYSAGYFLIAEGCIIICCLLLFGMSGEAYILCFLNGFLFYLLGGKSFIKNARGSAPSIAHSGGKLTTNAILEMFQDAEKL